MNKQLTTKIMSALLCTGFLVSTLTACQAADSSSQQVSAKESEAEKTTLSSETLTAAENEHTREYYQKQLETAEQQYNRDTENEAYALQYAQALFSLGSFDQAQEIIAPLMNNKQPLPEASYLSAQIHYLNGNYDTAEELYNGLLEEHSDSFGQKATVGLQMVYYQTNQYSKTQELSMEDDDSTKPLLDMMQAFGSGDPYQIDWNGKEKTAIPFTITDPLPIIPIEVNGVKMNALIDTGGDNLVVDQKKTAELGIDTIAQDTGSFAGGNTADIGFGKAESLSMGGIDIHNIPVMIGPFDGFTDAFPNIDIHAIIGTNVLQQFIPTMDYTTGQLVLRPRNEVGQSQLKEEQKTEEITEKIPFTLASTHYMFAKGSINGYDGLNMFVDSGLAAEDDAGMILPEETMDLTDIPMPELEDAVGGGMGGSDYQEASFDVDSYGLGNLQLKNGRGFYFTGDTLDMYDDTGFITDALISHNYLKQYKWTIDFDAMDMTFSI